MFPGAVPHMALLTKWVMMWPSREMRVPTFARYLAPWPVHRVRCDDVHRAARV